MSRTKPSTWDWNPNGCTLLPCVRELIQRAHLSTEGKGCQDYQAVWMPDLPLGQQSMKVAHDCTKMPAEALGRPKVDVTRSAGMMRVQGVVILMSETPQAGHAVYIATCHNCRSVFFASAWDRDDTLENYVAKLKCG